MKKTLALVLLMLVTVTHFSFAQKREIQNAFHSLNLGELEDALKSITNAQNDPETKDNPKTWLYRGDIMLAIQADPKESGLVFDPLSEAYKAFMKCRELDEKKEFKYDLEIRMQALAKAYYNLGAESYNKQQYFASYKSFVKVSDLTHNLNNEYKLEINTDTLDYLRAYSALKTERYDEAKKILSFLIDSSKYKSFELYKDLSDVYLVKKDTSAALKVIKDGRKQFPDENSLLISELNIYLFTHQFSEAISNLNEAIAKAPDSPKLYNALASAYDNMKDTTNAIKTYSKVIQLNPKYFDAYFGIARIYFNTAVEINGQMNKLDLKEQAKYDALKTKRDAYFQRALPYMEKAKGLNPKDKDTLTALKELYVRTNQMDKANELKKEIEGAK